VLPGFSAWRRLFQPDGVMFVHPDGAGTGAIRIRDRVRPLRSVAALVDEACAELRALSASATPGAPRAMVTLEGEHAAIAEIAGRLAPDQPPYVRVVGVVYGDDWFRWLDGHLVVGAEAIARTFVDRVELLVQHACLGLGARRRRWFRYTPPPGWHGRRHGLQARWFPPGYPREAAVIVVPPAKPLDEAPLVASLDRLLVEDGMVGFECDEQIVDPIQTASGLSGQLTRAFGCYPGRPPTSLQLAELTDQRFAYHLVLEAEADAAPRAELAFLAAIRSVAPVPEAAHAAPDAASLSYWAE